MEADWEFEVGGDGSVIEACWPGFFDLRGNPALAGEIPEAAELPALGQTLVRLNAGGSPVWTSKCGLWAKNDPEIFDPDEMDAPPGGTEHVRGCYIDLLPKSEDRWAAPDAAAADCKLWCARFRAIALRACRVDLIIRRSFFLPDRMGLGITAYVTGCGENAGRAETVLQTALGPIADVFCGR